MKTENITRSLRFENLALFGVILFLASVLSFVDVQDFRPNMDSMTYGVLAKNILRSGDWLTLHYTKQAYADFFQHPPLAIWYLAVVFRWFGVSNMTLKWASASFFVGTAWVVGAWAYSFWQPRENLTFQERSVTALIAVLILLTSARYLKPAAHYLLDSPLAFFLIFSGFLFHHAIGVGSREVRFGLSLISGLSASFAILTKGLPAFVLPVFILGISVLSRTFRRGVFGFLIGLALPLGLFLASASGQIFIQNYWSQSVAGRVGGSLPIEMHLAPLVNLAKTWWPWLPVWLFSWWVGWKRIRLEGDGVKLILPMLIPLGLVLGFALNGRFLEHYLVPFYPFAAVSIAALFSSKLSRHSGRILKGTIAVATLVLIASLFKAVEFQGADYRNPLIRLHERASRECGSISSSVPLVYAPETVDLWYGLALGAWATHWEPQVISVGEEIPTVRPILLVRKSDGGVPASWTGTVLIEEGPYRLEASHADLKADCRSF